MPGELKADNGGCVHDMLYTCLDGHLYNWSYATTLSCFCLLHRLSNSTSSPYGQMVRNNRSQDSSEAHIGGIVIFDGNFKNPNHEALGEEVVDAPFVKIEKSCAVCGRIGCKFYMCSCKGLDAYCSRACQGIAWPSHKILCTFKKVSLSWRYPPCGDGLHFAS